MRQFGKCILEHVSDTRGLACGLKFLCSSGSSLSAVLLGLRHAVKLVPSFLLNIYRVLEILIHGLCLGVSLLTLLCVTSFLFGLEKLLITFTYHFWRIFCFYYWEVKLCIPFIIGKMWFSRDDIACSFHLCSLAFI